jgi:hypothetical protein
MYSRTVQIVVRIFFFVRLVSSSMKFVEAAVVHIANLTYILHVPLTSPLVQC